jgi:hypothetical protein
MRHKSCGKVWIGDPAQLGQRLALELADALS